MDRQPPPPQAIPAPTVPSGVDTSYPTAASSAAHVRQANPDSTLNLALDDLAHSRRLRNST